MYVFITCGGIKSVGTHWKWKRDICFRKYIRRWVFVILLGIIHAYMAIYIAHKYLGIYENMCIGLTVKLFRDLLMLIITFLLPNLVGAIIFAAILNAFEPLDMKFFVCTVVKPFHCNEIALRNKIASRSHYVEQ